VFENEAGSKIGDFGRAWSKDFRAAHDDFQIAGDPGYAPPELLYGDVAVDVSRRRYGCDAYHLGSLVVFLFTRAHMNALLLKHLSPAHWPITWGGRYAEVLPYIQAAFGNALAEFSAAAPEQLRDELTHVVEHLCMPDPSKRGHPSNRRGGANQFGLERFISVFDRLSLKAELQMIGGKT